MRFYDIDDLENRDESVIAAALKVVETIGQPYFRSEVRGLEHIPSGAGLFVGNHNGGIYMPEGFLLGAALYRTFGIDGVPYGLAHEVVMQLPFLNELIVRLGGVRASHSNAQKLFDMGRKVLVYPGGDVEAMRPYRDRDKIVFDGRQGYIRLALSNSVPILPVVAAGAHATFRILDDGRWLAKAIGANRWLRAKVWPITLCLPWGIWIGPPALYIPWPTKILIEVLEPIHFERSGPQAAADEKYVKECADKVEGAMQSALTRLAAEREGKS